MPKKSRIIKVTDVRGDKPWLKKRNASKYVASLVKKKTFLIVCEGQCEELYFKSFPVVTAQVKAVPLGQSNAALIACAKELAKLENYDEVWCVFDMDLKEEIEGQKEDFDNSIKAAVQHGFKCAYSNDAFELWYVLHYHYIDQEQLRGFFYEKLSELWDINYERDGKKRDYATTIYAMLDSHENANQTNAIASAKKLHEAQRQKPFHQQNPVTTVYELVEELNLHLRK